MQIQCKACRSKVAAEDVNLERGLAKCRACQAIFAFADQVKGADQPRPVPRERGEVAPPKSIKIHEWGSSLVITRRWFTPAAFFLAFFCVAWDAFLIFWYSMAVSGDGPPGAFRWIMMIFPIAHVVVGIGLTYFTLALFLNRTKIEAERGRLTVRHRPLPWAGNHDLSTDDLDQLYCKEKVRYGKHGSRHETYQLMAVTRGGGQIKLLSGLNEADQAISIEQAIERHLGIEDRPVRGEVGR